MFLIYRKISFKSNLYKIPIQNETREFMESKFFEPMIEYELTPSEKLHLRARRIHPLESSSIYLSDGRGNRWLANIGSNYSKINIISKRYYINERKRIVCLALPERTPLEKNFLPAAIELGLTHFQPIITDRTNKHFFSKERVHRIIEEASAQSERLHLARVYSIKKIKKLVHFIKKLKLPSEQIIVLDPNQKINLQEYLKIKHDHLINKTIVFIIGPEGGFSPEEINLFSKIGYTLVSLGETKNILRVATAACTALAKMF